ncbi:MAG: DNA primase, partial [Micavibrio sp.]
MAIPPRFLDELRSRITLSDVIRKSVRLTRAGREFKGCCPFHNEKTPSFYVNDDKQFYHCFGCGAHGTVIDFAMRHDNLTFPEAVETLAALAGLQVPKSAHEDIERAKLEKSLYTMMEDAARWMEEQLRLPANRAAMDYMLERGLSEEILSSFRVGYAPDDRQAMRSYLASRGYTDAQMIEAALIRPASEGGREPYAFFRERVMFPVPDRRGRVVAFGGRALPDHLRAPTRGDYTPAKYMNSSDTPLFHKGRMLYGEPHARKAAADGMPVIVVEGYLDVIAAHRAGFKGAVAPLGTALTEAQISVLWKMIPQDSKVPVLCFDGDEAGRRAASRACERILPMLKPSHSARIAFLPEGEDPDTLVRAKGAQAFEAVLGAALNLVDFLWQDLTAGKSLDTPEERAGLVKSLEDT